SLKSLANTTALSTFFASPAIKIHQIKKHVLFNSRPLVSSESVAFKPFIAPAAAPTLRDYRNESYVICRVIIFTTMTRILSEAEMILKLPDFRWTLERYRAAIEAGVLTEYDKVELLFGKLVLISLGDVK
ncbi:MAG: hypothetical protein ACI9G6_003152, partial [Limisphaerales bacterium]